MLSAGDNIRLDTVVPLRKCKLRKSGNRGVKSWYMLLFLCHAVVPGEVFYFPVLYSCLFSPMYSLEVLVCPSPSYLIISTSCVYFPQMVLSICICPCSLGRRSCPNWRSLSISGLVHEWGENEAWDGRADQGGVSSNVGAVPVRCGEERAEPWGEALDLTIHLCPNPHLWSRSVGSDRKNKVANTSGWNKLTLRGGWPQP